MNDILILELVKTLDELIAEPQSKKGNFEFFTIQPVVWLEKSYRVVLTMCQGEDFLGVN